MPDVFSLKELGKKRVGLFTTFCPNPTGVSFNAQEDNEEIILFLRKHLVTNLPWIFATSIFLLIPLLLLFFMPFFSTPFPSIPTKAYPIIIATYYLAVVLYAFVQFITWFYNISLITTKRVMDIDFASLLYHNVAVTRLELVEDVDYTQVGVIRSLFDYGDVFVQTAGEVTHFDFLATPKPATTTEVILDLIGKKHGS